MKLKTPLSLKADQKNIRILNRIVSWESFGIVYEADQRHAEIIIRLLGFNERTKALVTPGDDECSKVVNGDDEVLDKDMTSTYRAIVARANYLAALVGEK